MNDIDTENYTGNKIKYDNNSIEYFNVTVNDNKLVKKFSLDFNSKIIEIYQKKLLESQNLFNDDIESQNLKSIIDKLYSGKEIDNDFKYINNEIIDYFLINKCMKYNDEDELIYKNPAKISIVLKDLKKISNNNYTDKTERLLISIHENDFEKYKDYINIVFINKLKKYFPNFAYTYLYLECSSDNIEHALCAYDIPDKINTFSIKENLLFRSENVYKLNENNKFEYLNNIKQDREKLNIVLSCIFAQINSIVNFCNFIFDYKGRSKKYNNDSFVLLLDNIDISIRYLDDKYYTFPYYDEVKNGKQEEIKPHTFLNCPYLIQFENLNSIYISPIFNSTALLGLKSNFNDIIYSDKKIDIDLNNRKKIKNEEYIKMFMDKIANTLSINYDDIMEIKRNSTKFLTENFGNVNNDKLINNINEKNIEFKRLECDINCSNKKEEYMYNNINKNFSIKKSNKYKYNKILTDIAIDFNDYIYDRSNELIDKDNNLYLNNFDISKIILIAKKLDLIYEYSIHIRYQDDFDNDDKIILEKSKINRDETMHYYFDDININDYNAKKFVNFSFDINYSMNIMFIMYGIFCLSISTIYKTIEKIGIKSDIDNFNKFIELNNNDIYYLYLYEINRKSSNGIANIEKYITNRNNAKYIIFIILYVLFNTNNDLWDNIKNMIYDFISKTAKITFNKFFGLNKEFSIINDDDDLNIYLKTNKYNYDNYSNFNYNEYYNNENYVFINLKEENKNINYIEKLTKYFMYIKYNNKEEFIRLKEINNLYRKIFDNDEFTKLFFDNTKYENLKIDETLNKIKEDKTIINTVSDVNMEKENLIDTVPNLNTENKNLINKNFDKNEDNKSEDIEKLINITDEKILNNLKDINELNNILNTSDENLQKYESDEDNKKLLFEFREYNNKIEKDFNKFEKFDITIKTYLDNSTDIKNLNQDIININRANLFDFYKKIYNALIDYLNGLINIMNKYTLEGDMNKFNIYSIFNKNKINSLEYDNVLKVFNKDKKFNLDIFDIQNNTYDSDDYMYNTLFKDNNKYINKYYNYLKEIIQILNNYYIVEEKINENKEDKSSISSIENNKNNLMKELKDINENYKTKLLNFGSLNELNADIEKNDIDIIKNNIDKIFVKYREIVDLFSTYLTEIGIIINKINGNNEFDTNKIINTKKFDAIKYSNIKLNYERNKKINIEDIFNYKDPKYISKNIKINEINENIKNSYDKLKLLLKFLNNYYDKLNSINQEEMKKINENKEKNNKLTNELNKIYKLNENKLSEIENNVKYSEFKYRSLNESDIEVINKDTEILFESYENIYKLFLEYLNNIVKIINKYYANNKINIDNIVNMDKLYNINYENIKNKYSKDNFYDVNLFNMDRDPKYTLDNIDFTKCYTIINRYYDSLKILLEFLNNYFNKIKHINDKNMNFDEVYIEKPKNINEKNMNFDEVYIEKPKTINEKNMNFDEVYIEKPKTINENNNMNLYDIEKNKEIDLIIDNLKKESNIDNYYDMSVNLGMFIPKSVENKFQYYLNELDTYRPILLRNENEKPSYDSISNLNNFSMEDLFYYLPITNIINISETKLSSIEIIELIKELIRAIANEYNDSLDDNLKLETINAFKNNNKKLFYDYLIKIYNLIKEQNTDDKNKSILLFAYVGDIFNNCIESENINDDFEYYFDLLTSCTNIDYTDYVYGDSPLVKCCKNNRNTYLKYFKNKVNIKTFNLKRETALNYAFHNINNEAIDITFDILRNSYLLKYKDLNDNYFYYYFIEPISKEIEKIDIFFEKLSNNIELIKFIKDIENENNNQYILNAIDKVVYNDLNINNIIKEKVKILLDL